VKSLPPVTDDSFVKKAGDVMTGALTLPGNPTLALHAVPQQYVEAVVNGAVALIGAKVAKAGDVMTGALTLPADPVNPLEAATKQYVDANAGGGGGGIPEAPADTKTYGRKDAAWVDITAQLLGGYVAKAGDTMTGDLTVSKSGALVKLTRPGHSVASGIYGQQLGVDRWRLQMPDASAESVSGTSTLGSDFRLEAFNNAGTSQGVALKILRAALEAQFGGDVRIVKSAPTLFLDGPGVGNSLTIRARLASKNRWIMLLGDSYSESGANAGSDFRLERYDDAGTTKLGTPLFVSRATGIMTLESGIAFPATQNPSADVNTLDDYEEGVWVPTISFGGASVGVTYGVATGGTYVKIGRRVTYTGRIFLTSKGSSVGGVAIGGMPFAVGASDPVYFPYYSQTASVTGLGGLLAGAVINPYVETANTVTWMSDANCTNALDLIFGGMFHSPN
jgi:hypothetical protein